MLSWMNKTSGGMYQFTMLSLGTSHQLRGGGLGATKWYGGVASFTPSKKEGGGRRNKFLAIWKVRHNMF